MREWSASRRYASVAGWVLAGASAFFLAMIARERREDIGAIDLSSREWLGLAALAGVYGVSLFLLAGAWHCVLRALGAAPARALVSVRSFTTSQLAKYVPGNVFHYIGRHMLLRKESIPHDRLVASSVSEVALMLLAAGFVVSLMLVLARPPLAVEGWVGSALALGVAGGLGVLGAAAVVVVMIRRVGAPHPWWTLAAFACYIAFFVILGLVFAGALHLVGEAPILLAVGIGVAGWVVGFVTPGAPAGAGTREVALLLLASPLASQEVLLVAALLFRVVTLAGDVVCFALGLLLAPIRKTSPT